MIATFLDETYGRSQISRLPSGKTHFHRTILRAGWLSDHFAIHVGAKIMHWKREPWLSK